jgi:hypothetical protein
MALYMEGEASWPLLFRELMSFQANPALARDRAAQISSTKRNPKRNARSIEALIAAAMVGSIPAGIVIAASLISLD